MFISTTAIFTSLPSASRTMRLDAELAVQSSTLDWTILRPTMIYGTARDRNISRLLRFLKRWPVFPLYGNGLWQPIYVEDLADAVVAALDNPRTRRRVYNVAGAQPLALADLVRTAARAVGRNVTLIRVPLRAAVVGAKLTRIVTAARIPTDCPGPGRRRESVPRLEGGARRPATHTERRWSPQRPDPAFATWQRCSSAAPH